MSISKQILQDDVAARTRELLVVLNQSQKSIAAKLGIAQSFLSQVASGKNMPSIIMLNGLRASFGVSLDWYVNGIGEKFATEDGLGPKDPLHDLLDQALALASSRDRTHIANALELVLDARGGGERSPPQRVARSA